MFTRWSPQFQFLNTSSPEWGLVEWNHFWYHVCSRFFIAFLCSNGSITGQLGPAPHVCYILFFFSCTLQPPASDTVSGAAFNWAVKVQASTPQSLLTTRFWSLRCFMNAWCWLRSGRHPYGNSYISRSPTPSNASSLGWAFTHKCT